MRKASFQHVGLVGHVGALYLPLRRIEVVGPRSDVLDKTERCAAVFNNDEAARRVRRKRDRLLAQIGHGLGVREVSGGKSAGHEGRRQGERLVGNDVAPFGLADCNAGRENAERTGGYVVDGDKSGRKGKNYVRRRFFGE